VACLSILLDQITPGNAFSPLHNFGTFGLRTTMPKISAGLLMYRRGSKDSASPEVLLVHPGGPFWKSKDDGAWTIPKGEVDPGEKLLAAAIREFNEETGLTPEAPFVALGQIKQKSGKIVHAWAFQGDCDPTKIRSNTFEVEWPPKSGRRQAFPEIDRAGFFVLPTARRKMLVSEVPLLDRFAVVISEE
jgi:predicted NUDIX family NTP pyrophosphohydrolase